MLFVINQKDKWKNVHRFGRSNLSCLRIHGSDSTFRFSANFYLLWSNDCLTVTVNILFYHIKTLIQWAWIEKYVIFIFYFIAKSDSHSYERLIRSPLIDGAPKGISKQNGNIEWFWKIQNLTTSRLLLVFEFPLFVSNTKKTKKICSPLTFKTIGLRSISCSAFSDNDSASLNHAKNCFE